MYLNVYYITGIGVAIKPLLCVGDEGDEYLKFAPAIQCWEEQHWRGSVQAQDPTDFEAH